LKMASAETHARANWTQLSGRTPAVNLPWPYASRRRPGPSGPCRISI